MHAACAPASKHTMSSTHICKRLAAQSIYKLTTAHARVLWCHVLFTVVPGMQTTSQMQYKSGAVQGCLCTPFIRCRSCCTCSRTAASGGCAEAPALSTAMQRSQAATAAVAKHAGKYMFSLAMPSSARAALCHALKFLHSNQLVTVLCRPLEQTENMQRGCQGHLLALQQSTSRASQEGQQAVLTHSCVAYACRGTAGCAALCSAVLSSAWMALPVQSCGDCMTHAAHTLSWRCGCVFELSTRMTPCWDAKELCTCN